MAFVKGLRKMFLVRDVMDDPEKQVWERLGLFLYVSSSPPPRFVLQKPPTRMSNPNRKGTKFVKNSTLAPINNSNPNQHQHHKIQSVETYFSPSERFHTLQVQEIPNLDFSLKPIPSEGRGGCFRYHISKAKRNPKIIYRICI